MEWSWLKDWWRLKRLRRRQKCHDGYLSNDNDDDEENYNEFCYCDECMNGDIDLCDGTEIDSDGSVSSCSGKQVVVGVCAMAKKSQSKPMKEILTRLQEFEYIKIVVFPEEVILKDPVEKWPVCDCLISFHSKGFPLEKAVNYAQLRKPYVINNLHTQYDIQDRRKVYSILESEGIEIPRYAVLDRDSPDPKHHELLESEDHVEVNGVIFNKPFVEKPVSAEDHNIYIYYPTSAGGGSQRLFRKIGSRSSVYSPESRVRKTGSFIYEDFMPTDGTDVKVYTVGPDYAHAEARKSPALDGKVERDREGKEIRYPVILSNGEKLISRKVCLAFKQTVCGFDLLRANGKSYVCDVNGFSFVKNSNKYYDDCAKILGNMILRELTPTLHIPWSVPFQLDDPPIVPTTFGKMMELRCVVAVIRHGDRTPKQKMKVEVRHPKFFEIFEKYDGYKHGHVKLKRPKQLQEILDIARYLLTEIQTKSAESEVEEKQGKLEQLKSVLEMYGHFSGINRKVQMKYQPKGRPRGSSSDDGMSLADAPKEPSLVLILKWGGELTPAGRVQAEELGRIFRCMYPGGQGRHDYSGTQGLGLLSISRLHSTFRHDLKIYASDEGRVQMTAAAFAKGLLALEGELTPILVQMVKSANTNGLLDNDCDSSKYQNMAKNRLHELMQIDRDFTQADREAINPGNSVSINQALDFVRNPVKCCTHVCSLIQSLMAVIAVKRDDPKTRDAILYHGETWELMGRRWGKIEKDFSTKTKTFDISKIPDIYDCIKYDLQHNQHTLQFEQAEELYINAKYLADIVIPQEYGLTVQEKIAIGQGICTPLLKKIKSDLQRNIEEAGDESVNRLNPRYSHGVSSPGRHVRTRLYFTSESHVHSLLTVLRYGGLLNTLSDEQWRRAMEYVSMVSELNYMSQIVIMLYEDPTKDPCSEERFHVELHFSPGVNCCVQKNLPPGPGFRPHSRNDSVTSKSTSGEEDSMTTRIDEEGDVGNEEESAQNTPQNADATDSSAKGSKGENSPSEIAPLHQFNSPKIKSSEPIPIGSCHTVSGHEAMDLAKRLSKELASQQQLQGGSLGATRSMSPDTEPRSRSYETTQSKAKAEHYPRYQSLQAVNDEDITATTTAASSVQTSSSTNTVRRQRHSIAGQMSYFKMFGFGGFSKKMASTNSLFSTAVISGSSSAPNLRDMIPSTASPSVLEGIGGVPSIRPLETLHNALSLRQLDSFLETMTAAPMFKTPASSPPKYPSTPLPTPVQTPQNSIPEKFINWSGQSSMTSSLSALSSGGPPSPNISESFSRGGYSSTDMSASINSTDELGILGATAELCQMFPTLDADLCAVSHQLTLESLPLSCTDISQGASGELTPISTGSDFDFNTNDATKGSSTNEIGTEDSDEETTVSATADVSFPTDGFLSMDNLKSFNVANEPFKKSLETYQTSVMNIKRKLSEKCSSEDGMYLTGAMPKPCGRSPRIQKQISAYERESRKMIAREPLPGENQPHYCISADDINRSVAESEVPRQKKINKEAKTKSCANLKIFSNAPGALVVKEKFIAPPKRVANSFHGKTQFSQNSDLFRRTISQGVVANAPADAPANRFTTTIVPEACQESQARATKED
ncbi:inositol hexakisphosphate and diphosphoinositol-pentakisphosphate kinase isoform X9 [Phlebotomus argentipes]|uniref:inositol hexakisphosphate and diphosphoinositol-pentakisphosphate kinase isoform X9 n=1 Tax=Phlebotomus argentipes TaxID=94469 RepID=UPI0028935854|nr:inositol hexakisphosphate and diphosphoinositol-pentakisphosphate kinase isoform X9 [Phlebotomus argentipes]